MNLALSTTRLGSKIDPLYPYQLAGGGFGHKFQASIFPHVLGAHLYRVTVSIVQ